MGESVIRKNSVLARDLGDHGVEFISFVAGSLWASTARTHIRLTISFGDAAYGRSISTLVHRRGGDDGRAAKKTLDDREYDICRKISDRSIEIARDFTGAPFIGRSPETTQALRTSFDEVVIARHLESHFELKMPVAPIFSALRRMSEQTYENKAL